MRGDNIIIRAYKGEPVVLRVWGIDGDVVFATGARNFRMLVAGLSGPAPMGHPIGYVFSFDDELLQKYQKGAIALDDFWQSLRPYQPSAIIDEQIEA